MEPGFTAHAEQLAEEIRADLGLSVFDRLHPLVLAEHLAIRVLPLGDLIGSMDEGEATLVRANLIGDGAAALSAVTVFRGRERQIVHNDSHSAGRQASNLCHELAHALLLHPPKPALDDLGCRDWDGTIEEEANYLGGCLLIPGKAARGAKTRNYSVSKVALLYGTSEEMARWRMNVTSRRPRSARAAAGAGAR